MIPRLKKLAGLAIVAALLCYGIVSAGPGAAAGDSEEDAAVARTRKTVRMLDDLYKTVVVLITEHYVEIDSDLPAGSAAIALFAAMKEKGWHEVRLLDATGDPIEENNSPRDDFERDAIKTLKCRARTITSRSSNETASATSARPRQFPWC